MDKKERQKFSESRNSIVLWIDYLRDVDHGYDDYNIKYHYYDNKTISDGGITVDFWFIKVHTSN